MLPPSHGPSRTRVSPHWSSQRRTCVSTTLGRIVLLVFITVGLAACSAAAPPSGPRVSFTPRPTTPGGTPAASLGATPALTVAAPTVSLVTVDGKVAPAQPAIHVF